MYGRGDNASNCFEETVFVYVKALLQYLKQDMSLICISYTRVTILSIVVVVVVMVFTDEEKKKKIVDIFYTGPK